MALRSTVPAATRGPSAFFRPGSARAQAPVLYSQRAYLLIALCISVAFALLVLPTAVLARPHTTVVQVGLLFLNPAGLFGLLFGINYLLKPITRNGLLHGLRKFEALRQHYAGLAPAAEAAPHLAELLCTVQQLSAPPVYKVSWFIPFKAKLIPVAIADVAHLIIRNGPVSLTTLENQHYPLDELEAQVDPRQFFRANRQVLLARPCITALEPYYNGRMLVHVRPSAPEAIIVPKPRVTELRHWLSGRQMSMTAFLLIIT